MTEVPYGSAVGNLMYAMVRTRPNIAQVVGVASRYMSNLRKEHWGAIKWILKYLKGSSDMALCYDGTDVHLHGYVDFNFAGDVDSQRSTTDYVHFAGDVNNRRSTTDYLLHHEARHCSSSGLRINIIWGWIY